jgi:hypothetical protein
MVKAGNTLGADVLGSDPLEGVRRRVIFVPGDDANAKSAVASLFEDAGSPRSTSATWRQAAQCSRSTTRSPAST